MSKLIIYETRRTYAFICFLISLTGALIELLRSGSYWIFLLPLCFFLVYLYCWRIWKKEKGRVLATNKWNNFHNSIKYSTAINSGGTASTVSVTWAQPSVIEEPEPETDEIRIKRIKRELGYGEDNQ